MTVTPEVPEADARAGGFELRTGALFSAAFAQRILGLGTIELPLTRFGRSVQRVTLNFFYVGRSTDVLFGDNAAAPTLGGGTSIPRRNHARDDADQLVDTLDLWVRY
jgi:hypothetical protein